MTRWRHFTLPLGMALSVPDPEPQVTYGTYLSPMPLFRFKTPGELWREAAAEALAFLAGNGITGGGFTSEWTCFRCAVPVAPAGDVFGLGRARIRRVRLAPAPAWQAGKIPGVFDV